MKKAGILSVVALGLAIAAPQITKAETTISKNQAAELMVQDVTYQEINADKLPEAVVNAFSKGYEGYKVGKVYLGSDGSYKLEAVNGDSQITVYYSENGELIRADQ